jgi:hypothetical protein
VDVVGFRGLCVCDSVSCCRMNRARVCELEQCVWHHVVVVRDSVRAEMNLYIVVLS